MPIDDPHWPRADQWLASASADPGLVVVGVPLSVTSLSPSMAHLTPQRLRQTLGRFSTFHSEHETDLASLAVADLGDWELAGRDAGSALAQIRQAAQELGSQGVIAFVGGDNAITRPLVAGTGPLSTAGVLTFDAHHDVRGLEAGPSNGNPIRGLFADGLPDGRVAQIGIHSFANSLTYRRFCEERQVAIFSMTDVDDWGIEDTVNLALQGLDDRVDWIYVDFDLDVLDVAFAPGCPGARPGGMTPRRLAAAAYMCGRHPKVRAADFVEVDPSRDSSEITMLNLANVLLAFAAGVADRPVAPGSKSG